MIQTIRFWEETFIDIMKNASNPFSMLKPIKKNLNRWLKQRQEKCSNLGTLVWNIIFDFITTQPLSKLLNFSVLSAIRNFTYFSWYTFSEHTLNLFLVFLSILNSFEGKECVRRKLKCVYISFNKNKPFLEIFCESG